LKPVSSIQEPGFPGAVSRTGVAVERMIDCLGWATRPDLGEFDAHRARPRNRRIFGSPGAAVDAEGRRSFNNRSNCLSLLHRLALC
jgi:hypothetical protein